MLKKAMVLATAVACLAALAVPALATAEWKDKGVGLKQNGVLKMTGTFKWGNAVLGMSECVVKEEITLEPGTTGKLTAFAADGEATNVCKTTGLLAFLGCQVEEVTTIGLPWTVHTTPPRSITVTNGKIIETMAGALCPVVAITIDPGSYTETVSESEASAIKLLSLSGSLPGEVLTSSEGKETTEKATGTVGGSTTVQGEAAGTYGI